MPEAGAISIKEFCERYTIGPTKVFEEISTGRLIARKVGRRTIITQEDESRWLQSLPKAREAA